jgi:proton-dependent oligopeptide transporter, POT family
MWIGLKAKGHMDAAKPSYQEEYGRTAKTPWNDLFVEEIKRALVACKVFIFFPIYWVAYSQVYCSGPFPTFIFTNLYQITNNLISMAGTMELHGIPNDILQNLDPLTVIIFIPIFDRLIYPMLRRMGIPFKPISRITMGFFFAAVAMAYAAFVQHLIYTAPPCFNYPLADGCSNGGQEHNHVHVAIQAPAYMLIAVSEIFASVTGLEYAYTKAPPNMKSFVMSIFLLTSAGGNLLGIALSPTAKDPSLMWMYIGLAISSLVASVIFWMVFGSLNAAEETMNALDRNGEGEIEDDVSSHSGSPSALATPIRGGEEKVDNAV